MTADSSDDLIQGLRSGDNAAWAKIIAEYGGPLRAYLRMHGCDDPDNTLGEVFLGMARGIKRFEGDLDSLRSWAYTIARRRMIDTHRYRSRRPQVAVDPADLSRLIAQGGDVEDEAIEDIGTQWAFQILSELTALQRDVIALRFVAGLTTPEVAKVMGTTQGAVKSHQRRALRRLRRSLDTNSQAAAVDVDDQPTQVSKRADPTMDTTT